VDATKAFSPYWSCFIKEFRYDALGGLVQFVLQEPENLLEHPVSFHGVTLLIYMKDECDPFAPYDINELTSISFYSETIDLSKAKLKWLRQYTGKFNVSIENWSSVLLLNAERVMIDSKEYQLT
jgi:hypothetical protein